MAIGTVDGNDCQVVNMNASTGKRQRLVSWIVPGASGVGAQKLGMNDAEWTCALVYFDTKANVDAFAVLMDAVQGTVVTIVDSKGDTYTGLVVEKVSNRKTHPALHAKTTAGVGLGVTGWSYRATLSGKVN